MQVSVFRKSSFNAAHRLNNPVWDEATNKQVFGVCNNANYHGHNYELEVEVRGEINPETGYVYDLKKLKEIIEENITERWDHRNLNLDIPEFKTLNPTAENIVVVCWQILRAKIENKYQITVRLHETERNFVEFSGE
ncbi:MAG: 6-carboxytetrahydropterin synthase [Bacteroidetes bacterium]|nr:6-carboxytetrahydropterin synthase [Bacteroidota bacterium]